MGSVFRWHPMAEKGRDLLADAGYDTSVSDAGIVIQHLQVARKLGSPLLRCVAGNLFTRDEGHDMAALADGVVEILREACPAAEDMGLKIALENHADFTVRELASILARVNSPAFGFTLDTANLAFDLDEPLRLARIMAPHTLTTHFKNYRIVRTAAGLALENCALGDGEIDVVAIAEMLAEQHPDMHLNIEIHSQFAPFTLNMLDPTYFDRHPSPPGDGLAWYLQKAWREGDSPDATGPSGRRPASWRVESEHLQTSVRWAREQGWRARSSHDHEQGARYSGSTKGHGRSTPGDPHRAAGVWLHGQVPHQRLQEDPLHLPRRGHPAAAAGPVRQERSDRGAGGGPLRLRGVLHRLAGTGAGRADRRVRQLRSRSGPSGAVHRRAAERQARDLRKADGHLRRGRAADARGRGQLVRGKAMCTFNYRFFPAVRLAKDLIAGGRTGPDLPHPDQLPADGGARSVVEPRPGLVLGLAALGRAAGDRQPRHRPMPFPGGRDQERFRPGAHVQLRPGPAQRGMPARHVRRGGGRGAGVRQRSHRRPGVVGGRHGPKELLELGNQRLKGLLEMGPGAPQQPVRLPGRRRPSRRCTASPRSR